jgi:hypothetical protein
VPDHIVPSSSAECTEPSVQYLLNLWPGVIVQGFPDCPFLITLEMGAVRDRIYRRNPNCRQKGRGRGTGLSEAVRLYLQNNTF